MRFYTLIVSFGLIYDCFGVGDELKGDFVRRSPVIPFIRNLQIRTKKARN